MDVKIIIDTDNDAFDHDPHEETARILRALAKQIKDGRYRRDEAYRIKLRDINGNTVGMATRTKD